MSENIRVSENCMTILNGLTFVNWNTGNRREKEQTIRSICRYEEVMAKRCYKFMKDTKPEIQSMTFREIQSGHTHARTRSRSLARSLSLSL